MGHDAAGCHGSSLRNPKLAVNLNACPLREGGRHQGKPDIAQRVAPSKARVGTLIAAGSIAWNVQRVNAALNVEPVELDHVELLRQRVGVEFNAGRTNGEAGGLLRFERTANNEAGNEGSPESAVPLSLIILEDEPAHVQAIVRSLEEADPTVEIREAHCLREYFELVAERTPAIALLDLNLPDGNKMEALNLVSPDNPFPVLVMTSCGNEDVAVAAMKSGALDYLVKSPETFANMSRALHRVLREWNLIQAHKKAVELLQESEALQRDVLNSLPAHIAVLDKAGKILAVNEPWLEFAHAEGLPPAEKIGVGVNYLHICGSIQIEGDFYAEAALAGLQSVISGKQKSFSLNYPCAVQGGDRWFSMEVIRSTGNVAAAIVSHTDITVRKEEEDAQRHLEVMTKANLKLKKEIAHRQATEALLQKTLEAQACILEQAQLRQEKLRDIVHQTLAALDEDRNRIIQVMNELE